MEVLSRSLALALGVSVCLLGCKDQGTLAPNDMAPLFAVDCLEKPDHPKCADPDPDPPPDPGGTTVLFDGGFNPAGNGWDWMEWDPGNDPDLLLDLYSENPFETDLDLSDDWISAAAPPSNGVYGPCIFEPADTDGDIIVALAEQLDGIMVPADTPEEEHIRMTRISVETAGTSVENFARFLYLSSHPALMVYSKKVKDWVPGDVGFQVGGYWNTWGYPEVTVTGDGDTEIYTFTGGTVSVAFRNPREEPRLQCPLEDVVVVKVK